MSLDFYFEKNKMLRKEYKKLYNFIGGFLKFNELCWNMVN